MNYASTHKHTQPTHARTHAHTHQSTHTHPPTHPPTKLTQRLIAKSTPVTSTIWPHGVINFVKFDISNAFLFYVTYINLGS